MTPRAPLARYRQLLDQVGFVPSQRRGQNFLLQPGLHRVVVDALAPQPTDLVLEVGAGLGFLTRELVARCRVLAVEVDQRLCELVTRELGGHPHLRLLAADVLSGSGLNPEVLAALEEERRHCPGRLLVGANLPYAISGPLAAALVTMPALPAAMVLMVQLEFARRLAAVPATKEYGNLSALLQLAYEVKLLRRVGAEAFWPRPRVDSAIVELRQRHEDDHDTILGWPAADRQVLARFLRQLFCARRKKLRNASVLQVKGLAEAAGELLEQRPDAVPPAGLLRLFQLWKSLDPTLGEA